MKLSKYNFFLKSDKQDEYIAYNSLSGALALLESENYNKIIEHKNSLNNINDELIKSLKEGGFIIEDSFDELQFISLGMNREKYSDRHLGLTIAPTSDCNFRCAYCYEKDSITNSYMNEETQENIINLVNQNSSYISELSVTWYGGEPLLAMDIIEKLSIQFMKICEENDIEYNAGIITNGYYLSKENVQKLNKYKVTTIQVTIDGDEKIHNKRRPHKDGSGTYAKIIGNLVENYDIIEPLVMRINTDKSNMNSPYKVVDDLISNNLQEKVTPYIGLIENDNDCYSSSLCMNREEFSEIDFEFDEVLKKKGFKLNILKRYPARINTACGADRLNTYVINANGDLYKCWSDIGIIERKIGNINEETPISKNLLDYILYDPTKNIKCKECKVLPLCMGGCPSKVKNNIEDRCASEKYKLKLYLAEVAENIKKEKDKVKEKEEVFN